MRDHDDTVPVTASQITRETSDAVVVLVEVVEGTPPLVSLNVFDSVDIAELEALHRYDVEMVGEQAGYLRQDDRIAARQRWLSGLRRGRPMQINTERTIRMRPEKVRTTA